MAVKIRLAQRGRRKRVTFDVVVADARAPRDGRFIEKIGRYNPLTNPANIEINEDRAFHWLIQGAQPSNTVKAMLSYRGIMLKKHLQIGVIKGAITQEQADAKLAEWLHGKESKIDAKRDKLAQSKREGAKLRKDAERKVKEARAEAIRKKEIVAEETAPTEENTSNDAQQPENKAQSPAENNTAQQPQKAAQEQQPDKTTKQQQPAESTGNDAQQQPENKAKQPQKAAQEQQPDKTAKQQQPAESTGNDAQQQPENKAKQPQTAAQEQPSDKAEQTANTDTPKKDA